MAFEATHVRYDRLRDIRTLCMSNAGARLKPCVVAFEDT